MQNSGNKIEQPLRPLSSRRENLNKFLVPVCRTKPALLDLHLFCRELQAQPGTTTAAASETVAGPKLTNPRIRNRKAKALMNLRKGMNDCYN